MSKSLIILIVAVAVVAGILVGRYAFSPTMPQTTGTAARQGDKDAAAAASRAMTFTQHRTTDH